MVKVRLTIYVLNKWPIVLEFQQNRGILNVWPWKVRSGTSAMSLNLDSLMSLVVLQTHSKNEASKFSCFAAIVRTEWVWPCKWRSRTSEIWLICRSWTSYRLTNSFQEQRLYVLPQWSNCKNSEIFKVWTGKLRQKALTISLTSAVLMCLIIAKNVNK